jgi:ribose 5-phosphate isomerase A
MVDVSDDKRAAAEAAVAEVRSGMRVGLGTGTTAAFAIDALANRARAGLSVETVATSLATAARATAAGLRVVDFADLDHVDIAIDGADEIDGELRAIKGGGGAMLREKIVAAAARRMIAIVDGSKRVERLGDRPVPVEVLPFAAGFVARRIEDLGGEVTLRRTDGVVFATDQRNVILDCRFTALHNPDGLAAGLASIPGMLGHGLFLDEIDALYVGAGGTVRRIERIGAGSTNGVALV